VGADQNGRNKHANKQTDRQTDRKTAKGSIQQKQIKIKTAVSVFWNSDPSVAEAPQVLGKQQALTAVKQEWEKKKAGDGEDAALLESSLSQAAPRSPRARESHTH